MPAPAGVRARQRWERDWPRFAPRSRPGRCSSPRTSEGAARVRRRARSRGRAPAPWTRSTSARAAAASGVAKALLAELARGARGRRGRRSSRSRCSSRTRLAREVWARLGFHPVSRILAQPLELLEARLATRPRRPLARLDPRAERRPALDRADARAVPAAARGRSRFATPPAAGSGSPTRCSTATVTRSRGSPASSPNGSAPSSSRSRSSTGRSCASSSTSAAGWSTSTSRYRPSTAPISKADELALEANPTLVARLTGADRDEVRHVARTAASTRRAARGRRALRADRAADGARDREALRRRPLPLLRPRPARAGREGGRLRDGRDRPRQPPRVDLRAQPEREGAGARRRLRAPRVGRRSWSTSTSASPSPALLPAGLRGASPRPPRRASASTTCLATTTTPTGAARPTRSSERLAELPVGESLFVDLAYLPWVMRLRELYGVDAPGPDRGMARRARRRAPRLPPSSRSCAASHERDRGSRSWRGGSGELAVIDVRAPGGVRRQLRGARATRARATSREPLNLDLQELMLLSEAELRNGSGSPKAPRSSPTATAAHARRSRFRSSRSLGYDARNYSGLLARMVANRFPARTSKEAE